MALEGRLDIRESIPASGDLSANQYHFVNIDTNGELALAGAGEAGYVLVDKPDAQGKEGTVILIGKTKVVAGGTISAGDLITPDASGEAVVATAATVDTTSSNSTQDVAGDQVCGRALEDAATGELFKMVAIDGGLI